MGGNLFEIFKSVGTTFSMDDELAEATLFIPDRYHGCGFINRNGTRKLIDYKTEEKCLLPTNDCWWRKAKIKHLIDRPYLNCWRVRTLQLLKWYIFLLGLTKVTM